MLFDIIFGYCYWILYWIYIYIYIYIYIWILYWIIIGYVAVKQNIIWAFTFRQQMMAVGPMATSMGIPALEAMLASPV